MECPRQLIEKPTDSAYSSEFTGRLLARLMACQGVARLVGGSRSQRHRILDLRIRSVLSGQRRPTLAMLIFKGPPDDAGTVENSRTESSRPPGARLRPTEVAEGSAAFAFRDTSGACGASDAKP